jgi:hypothetical protein
VLARADEAAQRRTQGCDDRRISEQDVLEALTAGGQWAVEVKAKLPPADHVRKWLSQREKTQPVDENGRLRLDPLAPEARRIIENAHVLAQQRGLKPIPNRLMLAAFLIDPDGLAAVACRQHHADPGGLAAKLIAATDGNSPRSFVLSHESCSRVVLPMLTRARHIQNALKLPKITEAILWKAYCDTCRR